MTAQQKIEIWDNVRRSAAKAPKWASTEAPYPVLSTVKSSENDKLALLEAIRKIEAAINELKEKLSRK